MKKLFVWPSFAPDNCFGLAFAIADTVQEAQDRIAKNHAERYGFVPCDWGEVEVCPVTESTSFFVVGGS